MILTNLKVKIGEYKIFKAKLYTDCNWSRRDAKVMVYWTSEGELTGMVIEHDDKRQVGKHIDNMYGSIIEPPIKLSDESYKYWIQFVKMEEL
jgi:hypothetical protein